MYSTCVLQDVKELNTQNHNVQILNKLKSCMQIWQKYKSVSIIIFVLLVKMELI